MIDDVNTRLLEILRSAPGEPTVDLVTPDEPNGVALGLFPYAVVENVALKNEPPEVVAADRLRRAPLLLDVHYLLSAHGATTNPEVVSKAHGTLARAMLTLREHGTVRIDVSDEEGDALPPHELRVTLNPISIEDMMRIWGGFPQAKYRLSVAFLVTPVPVFPRATPSGRRVVQRESRADVLVGGGRR